jgi:hypothetical protein
MRVKAKTTDERRLASWAETVFYPVFHTGEDASPVNSFDTVDKGGVLMSDVEEA